MTIRAVLFDLDGTLADTALDLGYALNLLRAERQAPPLPHAQIRPMASHGARGLLELGFDMGPEHPDFPSLRDRFLQLYEQNLCRHTVLFPGMDQLLRALQQRGLGWGIVTNKPMRYTDPLVAQLPWPVAPAVVVSGDTCAQAKPDPAPMLHAAQALGVPPEACVYLGDAERDMFAARAVGMPAVLANYGYIADHDQPDTWGAMARIDQPEALLALLDNDDWLQAQPGPARSGKDIRPDR